MEEELDLLYLQVTPTAIESSPTFELSQFVQSLLLVSSFRAAHLLISKFADFTQQLSLECHFLT